MPEVHVSVTTIESPWFGMIPQLALAVVVMAVIVVWWAWHRRSTRGAGH